MKREKEISNIFFILLTLQRTKFLALSILQIDGWEGFPWMTWVLSSKSALFSLLLWVDVNYSREMLHRWYIRSVQLLSRVRLFATPWTAAHQASYSSPTPGVYSDSCPFSQCSHPTISSSVIPFSHLQSFLASESFQMSQFFESGGQSFGASASVLPMNIQNWSTLGWTGWISLQSKGLSRVFSNTTVQNHQFFSAQLSL